MGTKKGQLIVFYGTNNLGKSTQARLLETRLKKAGWPTEYFKYPLYELEPSGPIINDYLRHDNPYNLNPREAQIIYALNRTQYQTELQNKLDQGINIIAEDYIGTSLAWGLGTEIDINFLERINNHLIKEDLAILFDGERFENSIEKHHKHETNDNLFAKVKQIHLDLAKKYNWQIINANLSIEEINDILFEKIKDFLLK
jgi:thymidylate kinase